MRAPLAVLFFLWGLMAPAQAAGPSCASPQEAARSLLDWLQPERWDPEAAATCLDLPPGSDEPPGDVAVKLKKVLDARGLYVPTDSLSADPAYKDASGQQRVEPLPSFPRLVLEKHGDRWLWSRDLVAAADDLYDETFSGFAGVVQRAMPVRLRGRVLGVESWQIVAGTVLVLLTLLAGLLARRLLVRQILRLARAAEVELTADLLGRAQAPLTWLIGGFVFHWGVPELQLGVRTSRMLLFLSNAVLSLSVILIAVRAVDVIAHLLTERALRSDTKLDDQLVPLGRKAAKVAVWLLGAVFMVENLGVDVASLLAGLGIGGLAFALAAKDTVENLFGSVMIFIDRPFQIGDWIITNDGTEGVVVEVGFRSTRIRTFQDSMVTVPNGKLAMATIDNMGGRTKRRVKVTLGLTYDTPRTKIAAYIQAIEAFLRADPAVAPGTLEVHLSAFGASSLDILIYYFLAVPDWHGELGERGRHYLEFIRMAEDLGISFAFPSTSLYVEKLPRPAGG